MDAALAFLSSASAFIYGISPLIIAFLSAASAYGFYINRAMSGPVRTSMILVFGYFSLIYLLIWGDNDLIDNALVVRIGLVVMLFTISFTNIFWALYTKKHKITYGRRKGDRTL